MEMSAPVFTTVYAEKLSHIPGLEDPLEKETATHSNILAWRIPGTWEPGGLHSPVYGVA